MQVWGLWHGHLLNMAASGRTQVCSKWGLVDSAGSETPQSRSNQKIGQFFQVTAATAEILPSEPQDEQSVSLEFFDDEDVDDIEPWSNVEQPSQES